MHRHGQVADNQQVREAIPALAALAGLIGDPQVRARGTLGGRWPTMIRQPDLQAAVLALAATVRTDRRDIAAVDFFQGMFTTALEPDEIIRAVDFERPVSAAYASSSPGLPVTR
ncbi:MAG: FAD binding domain-containing protein [Burkholderiaceae bacterium]